MSIDLSDYREHARKAIKLFWENREVAVRQQLALGAADAGNRGAVTAGKNMDGFADLLFDLATATGLKNASIFRHGRLVTLPGYFRPTKKWDLLILSNKKLVAAIEFKSQVGSFGNNFNNRTEEAIGTAVDLWTAYREGALGEQSKPFIGWIMLVEDQPGSRTAINDFSPHFPIFTEFKGASYAERYNILCKNLIREQLYTAACVMMTKKENKEEGGYSDLSAVTSFDNFIATLAGYLTAEAMRDR